ncbi:MAG: hypothetical protein MJE77_34960 [Proteobacteria bacterium]|nr:hypothetical protein [Pseudomonadota bacterium]
MEALRDIEAAYQEWERGVKSDLLIETIRSLCHRFDIELTHDRLSQMTTWDPEQLKHALIEISASRQWPRS